MDVRAIKQKLKIYDVLEHFGHLPRDGSGRRKWTHSIPCPFHHDENPSFRIYHDNQSFTCFAGCGAGDVFSLIALSMKDASITGTEPNFPATFATAQAITSMKYRDALLNEILNTETEKPGQAKPTDRNTGAGGTTTKTTATEQGQLRITDTSHELTVGSPFPLYHKGARSKLLKLFTPRGSTRSTTRPTEKGNTSTRRPSKNRQERVTTPQNALCAIVCPSKRIPPTGSDIKIITSDRLAIAKASERRAHARMREFVSHAGGDSAGGAARIPHDSCVSRMEWALRLIKAYELRATAIMIQEESLTRLTTRLSTLSALLKKKLM